MRMAHYADARVGELSIAAPPLWDEFFVLHNDNGEIIFEGVRARTAAAALGLQL